ncbi:nucleotidyltransferase family protein [Virgibacillus necropolis]|uniref:nucleotidyltransferase family protein n=1 Tax=Virgibacillus necropolis TaxID=163877 RepID=UPI00384ED990
MKIENKADIIQSIYDDEWMMDVLVTARSLNLPDWWICAGFVRSKVWDVIHGFGVRKATQDVDVVYFDQTNIDETEEKRLDKRLHKARPDIPWSVKNEARMHVRNNTSPYTSAEDAIAKFPETVTSIGVTLDKNNQLLLTTPHGIDDILNMSVRPTPYFLKNDDLMKIYHNRLREKKWEDKWYMVKIH